MTNWKLIKTILLVIIFCGAFFIAPKQYPNEPPIFIYPAVSIAVFLFGLFFLTGIGKAKKLTCGRMAENPLHIFDDPLPAYHFMMLCGFVVFIGRLTHVLIFGGRIEPETLIGLSISVSLFFLLLIGNKNYTKDKTSN